MKAKKNLIAGILSGFAMLVIMLDARCAADSAKESIDLCLRTVIPSLFPFFVLSSILNSSLLGRTIPFLRPLGKLCRIPKGGESLLLLGYVTGYPVGAQLIAQAHKDKLLTSATARRMLGFCSNAGPAFLFGMLSPIFADKCIPWLLWGIHIASSLLVGCVLPAQKASDCVLKELHLTSPGKALRNAILNLAMVCGWIVLFRILLEYVNRWFSWQLPLPAQVILSGALELANGCVALNKLSSAGQKFIIASGILAFGGLCVGIQTQSVTQGMGTGYYFPGKVLQAMISILISSIVQLHLFSAPDVYPLTLSTLCFWASGITLVIFLLNKKSCSIWRKSVI